MAYTLGQKQKICKAINKKYATGKFTIASCCKAQGINEKTFRRWDKDFTEKAKKMPVKSDKMSEIPESYEESRDAARATRKQKLKELAETALEYHLKLQEWDEKKQSGKLDPETNKVKVDKVEVTKKRKDPNPMLIRFTLENTDPENFKTKQVVQHEGENPFIALMKAAAANKTK